MHLIVVAHNIRSIHNVGSIFRTCDGFGVEKLYLTGYTPYPATKNDARPPYVRDKITKQIHKTALGAELSLPFEHRQDLSVIKALRRRGYYICALEQHLKSIYLDEFDSLFHEKAPQKIVLALGSEVTGLAEEELSEFDSILEIRMQGKKESFNVSVAAGIALYVLQQVKSG